MNQTLATLTKLIQITVVLAVCVAMSACQQPGDTPDALWQVKNAHIKVMPPGQTRAAVYLVLHNLGQQDRQILNIETDIAGQAEVHRHTYEDGMMKMRPVPHALIPANGSLVFEPGSYHIMLMDVAEPPAVGTQFTVTMEFDKGERFTFPVDVRPL